LGKRIGEIAMTGAERQRRRRARLRQEAADAAAYAALLLGPSGLARLKDAPPQAPTHQEKLAEAALRVEQFGEWLQRFAQQRSTLLTAEEQAPVEPDTWAALESDVPPEPGFDEGFEEIELKEDEPVPEGGEWLDAALQAQADAEAGVKQAAEEDALALKKQWRKEREGSVPGAESVELLFNRGRWQYTPKWFRVRRVPATDRGRHIPVTPELAKALSAPLTRCLYCRHSPPIPRSDWVKFDPCGTLLSPIKRVTWSGNAFEEAEAISRAAALSKDQTDYSTVTPDANDSPDVVADLLAEREQMVEETRQCIKERRTRDPYADPGDEHRAHASRSPEVNAVMLQLESDAVPEVVVSEEDKLPEDRKFIIDTRKEQAEALEDDWETFKIFHSDINDPDVLKREFDALMRSSITANDPEILERKLDALDFEQRKRKSKR
jgi:hypothetical protein